MHRPNQTLRHPLSWVLMALLLFAGILAGCGKTDDAAMPASSDDASETEADAPAGSDAEPVAAPVNPSIEDSAYAIIIAFEGGGDTLATETFRMQLSNFEAQARQQQPGVTIDEAQRRLVRQGIAQEYIRRQLLFAEAARLGLAADPAAVEAGIDRIVMQNRMESREALEQLMAEQGVTMDSLRGFIAEEELLRLVSQRIVEAIGKPTINEIEAFSRDQGDEVWAQHILFQGTDDESLQKANAVLDSAKAGADFFALARRHSEGPSAPSGGDLGYFSQPEMVPEFSEAAFALSDSGDVYPELVKTSFGNHIIRLLGRRAAPPMDTSRARIVLTQNRQRDAFEQRLRELRADADIRVNPDVIDADLDS